MQTQPVPEQKNSQPQITIQEDRRHTQQQNSHVNSSNKQRNPQSQDKDEAVKKSMQLIQQIRAKHPECIPVFYVKHEASPKDFPSPKIPFILFKKQLKIQQAMYNLYNQIQIKGLYFFCTRYDEKEKRMKYIIIKPGQTIEQIYNKYGKNGHLTLVYGDKTIGMGGINRMEKWLVRIMILLVTLWVFLYAHPMYLAYQDGGLSAVWDTFSLIWNRPERSDSQNGTMHQTYSVNQSNQASRNSQQIVFTQDDLTQDQTQQQDILRQKNEWKSSQNADYSFTNITAQNQVQKEAQISQMKLQNNEF